MKPEEKKKQPEAEPDYAKLLEKEYGDVYGDVIESCRADGISDKEIWETLESFG